MSEKISIDTKICVYGATVEDPRTLVREIYKFAMDGGKCNRKLDEQHAQTV